MEWLGISLLDPLIRRIRSSLISGDRNVDGSTIFDGDFVTVILSVQASCTTFTARRSLNRYTRYNVPTFVAGATRMD